MFPKSQKMDLDIKQYCEFYAHLLGFNPYGFQIKVAECLLAGKNVILSVPTGAGKTWASIMPFLYAKEKYPNSFPPKLIYSLPLRTLTNSIYEDVLQALEDNNSASIQTGENANDPYFMNDIVFSTIDQTLSNFLCFPLSLSKRQANINAGALIGSYLVFDEFHLLDPKLSMATTIEMLKKLRKLCRFCIMTATLSENYIAELKETLNAEVISIKDFPEDTKQISSLKIPEGKECKKTIQTVSDTICADIILKRHKQKTIVICNRVEKAQQIYNDIISDENLNIKESNIICLHSRYFAEDRKHKEKKIKELFGKTNRESAILISTQVIEAGMDISCDTMHVEISPINSFLQRAGRCARWEREYGEIYVYNILDLEEQEIIKIETDEKEILHQIKMLNNKYLPYDKTLCEKTIKQLSCIKTLDQKIAKNLVNSILTTKELRDYSLMKQSDFNRSKIQESWDTCEKNMYSQTIRDIQNIEIAIIDYSKIEKNTFMPYKYHTIGLFKWSFIKWAKDILKTNEDVIFIAESNKDSQFVDWDTLDSEGYQLKVVNDAYQLKNYYDIVFVDKSIFKYTTGAGLELGAGETLSPLKLYSEKEKQFTEYHKDTFIQHNKALIGCYEKLFKPNLNFVFKQLNTYWGENIDWDKLIKAMICLHDYGKLNSSWQKPMRKLQELKGNYIFDEVLAHSDFNELTDKEIEKQSGAKNKPPHAGIGAFIALEILGNNFKDKRRIKNILFPIVTAILKHHSPTTKSFVDFTIEENELNTFKELWTSELSIPIDIQNRSIQMKQKPIDQYLINSRVDNIGIITYFLLVRILRLCDQKATEQINIYLN